MKPKVSVIVPYYEADIDKPEILKRLTDSLVGADEIIIVWNDKMGYAKPINKGLAIAHGDYLIVLNDDLKMDRGGDLHSLCDPNFVTSPTIDGKEQSFWGCAFMFPRWAYEKIGGLDERYRISYFDDDDLQNELRKADIPMKCVPLVNFWNVEGGGRTLHTFPDHNEFFAENKQKFIDKWGHEPAYLDEYFQRTGKLPEKS